MMALARFPFGLLLALSTTFSAASSNLRTPRNLQTYSSYNDYYQQMLNAVNAERAKAGLSALCTSQKLADAAARHSKDMAEHNFMDHKGSDGSTLSERITNAGFSWTKVAENVAGGQVDVALVVESWMSSPGHRANIMSADYTMFGTSYAYNADSAYRHYWTQDFAAGETEACGTGSPTASQSTEQTEQDTQQGNKATKAPSQNYTPSTAGLSTPFALPSFGGFAGGNPPTNSRPLVSQTLPRVPTPISHASAIRALVTPASINPAPVTPDCEKTK